MKILMTTHYFASHQGGIEIVAGQLFRELADLDQEVVWIAADATPLPEASGTARAVGLHAFNIVEQRIGLPFPIPALDGLGTMYQEVRRADVVIVHDCLYLTNIAAYVFARRAGVPVIVIQHIGLVPYSSRVLSGIMKLANRLVTRTMLRGAQQVVFISETTKRYFSKIRFRNPPAVVFNGVDTHVFRPLHAAAKRLDLRRELGLPIDRPIVLFVGRFVEKKGLSVLKRMVEIAPRYTWAFAGWGTRDPKKWNAANVHVFSGFRGSRLADLYRASDLLVLPSVGEGFPLVLQEALASGLAAVCGAETLGADPEMKAFVRGVPVFRGDDDRTARAFLSAVDEFFDSNAKLQSKSEERRAFATSRYSWNRAAERYLELAFRLAPESFSPSLAMKASAGGSLR